ncbi:MAG: hypoxanthine phosphoribosyltransferase [Chlorobi bacterium]|nr:hypoxanthine phosphoribosyltransferase [Chlorobiota bacterium]
MSRLYSPGEVVVKGKRFVPFIPAEEIEQAVQSIGATLSQELDDQKNGLPSLFVCVLKGATLFCADLLRSLRGPIHLEFVLASSYRDGIVSSGSLTFTAPSGTEIKGRNVIVVEDIIDTGTTVTALRDYFAEHAAASVKVAALLYKPDANRNGERPEYFGFEIPNRFVIGYGLDYAEEGRNLAGIYVLDEREEM